MLDQPKTCSWRLRLPARLSVRALMTCVYQEKKPYRMSNPWLRTSNTRCELCRA